MDKKENIELENSLVGECLKLVAGDCNNYAVCRLCGKVIPTDASILTRDLQINFPHRMWCIARKAIARITKLEDHLRQGVPVKITRPCIGHVYRTITDDPTMPENAVAVLVEKYLIQRIPVITTKERPKENKPRKSKPKKKTKARRKDTTLLIDR